MLDFQVKGKACESCKKEFTDEAQRVYCPECGAPLHRECWENNGGCPYASRHASGFRWAPSVDEVWSVQGEQAANAANAEEEKRRQREKEIEERYSEKKYNGVSEREMMCFMHVNSFDSLRRLEIFKYMITEKKTMHLNLFSGLLSPMYQFYSGSLVFGAMLLVIYTILNLPSLMIMNILSFQSAEAAEAILSSYSLIDTQNTMMWIRIGIMVIVSLFGDYLYIQHMVSKIKKVRLKFEDEGSDEYLTALAKAGSGGILPLLACVLLQAALSMIIAVVLRGAGVFAA